MACERSRVQVSLGPQAAVAQIVERISEKDEGAGARPARGTECGCRITVIILPCQGREEGSTPFTRLNRNESERRDLSLHPLSLTSPFGQAIMIKPLLGVLKMETDLKRPNRGRILLLTCLILAGILFELAPIFESKGQETALAYPFFPENSNNLAIIGGNSLLPIADPTNPVPQPVRRIRVVVTGYSSTSWETDDDPFITAAGTLVREGIVANNMLPIGTKIKIPELFGDRIFVVEDRMNWEKGKYQIDIWFPDYWQALNFGARRTYIEILEG